MTATGVAPGAAPRKEVLAMSFGEKIFLTRFAKSAG